MPHYQDAAKAVEEMLNEESRIKTWFFTFGAGHPLHKHFVGIKANDPGMARYAMIHVFGKNWAFQYDANDPINGLYQQQFEWKLQPLVFLEVVKYDHHTEPTIKAITEKQYSDYVQGELDHA